MTDQAADQAALRFIDRLNAGITAHEVDCPSMSMLARAYNLSVDHTGGGCLTYALHEDDGWYFWLTSSDGATLPESPTEEGCFGGWYESQGDFWMCLAGTPADLLSVMWTLGRVARALFTRSNDPEPVNVDSMTLAEALQIAVERGLVHEDERGEVTVILARTAPVVAQEARVEAAPMWTSLDCAEALTVAQALLKGASDAAPDSRQLRGALATVDAILAQRGCEFMGVRDGMLTTAMDVAIFG